jgi:hypothetical protein
MRVERHLMSAAVSAQSRVGQPPPRAGRAARRGDLAGATGRRPPHAAGCGILAPAAPAAQQPPQPPRGGRAGAAQARITRAGDDGQYGVLYTCTFNLTNSNANYTKLDSLVINPPGGTSSTCPDGYVAIVDSLVGNSPTTFGPLDQAYCSCYDNPSCGYLSTVTSVVDTSPSGSICTPIRFMFLND